jgi:hypothetical protein
MKLLMPAIIIAMIIAIAELATSPYVVIGWHGWLTLFRDCVAGLLYYDRKEDEELPRGVIEQAIKDGVISVTDMSNVFGSRICSIVD